VHPDVAGASGDAEFKRLGEDYDELTKLIKSGFSRSGAGPGNTSHGSGAADSGRYGSEAQGNYSWSRAENQYSTNGPDRSTPPQADPWTPAQRVRNMVVAGIGVGAGSLFFASSGSDRLSSGNNSSVVPAARSQQTPTLHQPPREVSNYYKTRNSKGTVRVTSDDKYVSSVDTPKSRLAAESSDVHGITTMVRGYSPAAGLQELRGEPTTAPKTSER